MTIFIANRLSNGNSLFPVELRIDDAELLIVKPALAFLTSGMNKSLKYKQITSVEVISPRFSFSKIIISAFNLDKITVEGFEQAIAEEAARLIRINMKGL